SSPDALEIMKQMVTMIIMTICVQMLLGIGVKWDNPADICIALNPNVVATPVHVASTARVSIVFPGMPLILFPSNGYNAELIRAGRFRRNCTYASVNPTIEKSAHGCNAQWNVT